jgi:hypothetical protein
MKNFLKKSRKNLSVIPMETGIPLFFSIIQKAWIPFFKGMTAVQTGTL